MGDQLTVRLSPELARALRAAARQNQRKTSEIVRLALRQFLALPGAEGSRPMERVRGLIGSLDSGLPDLAGKHRSDVLESVKNAR